jgi:hypothetical protein
MTHEEILRELASLPPEGLEKAAEFIAGLREYYARQGSGHGKFDFSILGFFGIWRDRADMQDSTAWARTLRGVDGSNLLTHP